MLKSTTVMQLRGPPRACPSRSVPLRKETMDPGGADAADDDEARYRAALALNARLRDEAAQLELPGAGYGPSDGEAEADEDGARYREALALNASLRAQAARLPDEAGYGPADAGEVDGPEDLEEIEQLQQALQLNARLKKRHDGAEALARERAMAEAEAQRFRDESLMDFRGSRPTQKSRRPPLSKDPDKQKIARENAMLVRHMGEIQTERRPLQRPFLGGHRAASAIRRKETSRKILRENRHIATRLEKVADGVARRSSGYTQVKPLHEGPLQKRNREMALTRRARPVLQQPDMAF